MNISGVLKKIYFILSASEKKKLYLLSFMTLVMVLFESISIGFIIPIMNLFAHLDTIDSLRFLGWLYVFMGIEDRITFLIVLMLFFLVLFILKSAYVLFVLYRQFKFTGEVLNNLTGKVLSSYLYSPYSFHLEHNSSLLLHNLSTEVGNFASSVLQPLIIVSTETMIFIAMISLSLWAYPVVTIALIVATSFFIIGLYFPLRKFLNTHSIDRDVYGQLRSKYETEALTGVKEIQVTVTQNFFIQRVFDAAVRYQKCYTKFSVISNVPRTILEILLFVTMLALIAVSAHAHKNPAEVITMLTVIGAIFLKLLASINKVYLNVNIMHFYIKSLDNVYDILKGIRDQSLSKSASLSMAAPFKPGAGPTDIVTQKLYYQYKTNSKPIFNDFNVVIPAKKITAFAGISGAGKSTLIDILTGLLTPSGGALRYAGVAITEENIFEYRKKIGYVSQQIFLIDGTIEENIAFGIPSDAIQSEVLDRVLAITQLKSVIALQPLGIKTIVGERGIRLSGGQRQRIGIARALYRDPEILILDEATSALDGQTESQVMGDLIALYKKENSTIIIVAHRATTLSYADTIHVIEQGRIVDSGSFNDLMRQSEVFNRVIHQKEPDNGVQG